MFLFLHIHGIVILICNMYFSHSAGKKNPITYHFIKVKVVYNGLRGIHTCIFYENINKIFQVIFIML